MYLKLAKDWNNLFKGKIIQILSVERIVHQTCNTAIEEVAYLYSQDEEHAFDT